MDKPIYQLQLILCTYTQGRPSPVHLISGPNFSSQDLNPENRLRNKTLLLSLLDLFLDQSYAAITNSQQTIPETVSKQPRCIEVAHQMLARVEAGKCKAKCVAYEVNGVRHLLLIEHHDHQEESSGDQGTGLGGPEDAFPQPDELA